MEVIRMSFAVDMLQLLEKEDYAKAKDLAMETVYLESLDGKGKKGVATALKAFAKDARKKISPERTNFQEVDGMHWTCSLVAFIGYYEPVDIPGYNVETDKDTAILAKQRESFRQVVTRMVHPDSSQRGTTRTLTKERIAKMRTMTKATREDVIVNPFVADVTDPDFFVGKGKGYVAKKLLTIVDALGTDRIQITDCNTYILLESPLGKAVLMCYEKRG